MAKHLSVGAFIKEFFTLFSPIALGNLFTFGSAFITHLLTSPLGGDTSAGIFLSNQVMQLLVFAITGIEAAVTVLGAQSIGDSNAESFSSTVARSAVIALACSTMLTIICISLPNQVLSLFSPRKAVGAAAANYLRLLSFSFPIYSLGRVLIASGKCIGRARIALVAPLTSFAMATVLGLLSVRGPLGLGAVGAGISILAARVAELAVIILLLLRDGGCEELSPSALIHALGRPLRAFSKTLLPIILGQVAWGAETMLVTALISRFGGGIAAVAFGVLSALSNLAYALMSGASSAVGIMISKRVGGEAEGSERAHVASRGEILFIIVGAVGAILVLVLKQPFSALYSLSATDAAILGELAPILALTFIATAYSASTLFGIIKSGGDVKFVLLTDAGLLLLLTLPVSLLVFTSPLGITELYIATRLVHLFKCPIAYSRVVSGKWAKRLTKSSGSGTISI